MKDYRKHALIAGFAGLVSLTASPCDAETIRSLFQRELPNMPGKSISVVEVDFAPGSKADPHRHGQAFVFAYVLSGAMRSQLHGEQPKTYRAGESWFEPPGARHTLTENVSRSERAKLLVTFISNTGDPLKTPDQKDATIMTPTTKPNDKHANVCTFSGPPPQKMVDALYTAFGDNHSRAVHAKGIMATGIFEPSQEARQLSAASIFAKGRLPIVVRFSDFTGIPTIPDTIGDANPRGFAVKFKLPDSSDADVIAHSFNGFPTSTSEEFRQLLLAIGSSGSNIEKPTPLERFLAAHPVATTFLTTQKPPPESYATLNYYGVNAFEFTNAQQLRHFVRYRFVPEAGESVLTAEQLATKGPDYLQSELPARLAIRPAVFTWYAQVAEGSDVVGDPSTAWPDRRQVVKLGNLRIDRMIADPAVAEKATMFRPLNVPNGIAPADPMLGIRQNAYPLSFSHRQ